MEKIYDGNNFNDTKFNKIENNNLINLTKDNLDKLMEILLGAARVIINIRNDTIPKLINENNLLNISNNVIEFKTDETLCNFDNTEFGPFTAIFPEVENKNQYIYNKLFNDNDNDIKEDNYENFKKYNYGEILPQKLMSTLNNGKSVVIFGFGFSGSGKTYTLIEGDKHSNSRVDKSLLEIFIETNVKHIKSVEFLEIYPENNTIYTTKDNLINEIFKTKSYSTIIDKNCNEYNTIEGNDITSQNIIEKINIINTLRIKNLRILPTPNNPESSRSFLQITIKLKNNKSDTEGGQLVLFDMPGTENTVNIKSIMLGTQIFIDIKKNEGEEVAIPTLKEKHKDFKTKNITKNKKDYKFIDKKGYLCNILFKNNKKKYCELANQYVAMEIDLFNNLTDNFRIYYNKIYEDYYNNISKIVFLKTSELFKNQFNIIFKYFILNIYGFQSTGINFYKIPDYNESTPILPSLKTSTDENIANIGIEIALFFNGKAGKTIKDINTNDTIYFLKDEDFKKIYDNFFTTYILKKKDNKTIFINTENGYNLYENLLDEDLKLIANIFSICNGYTDKNITENNKYKPYFVTAFVKKFGNFNKKSNFFKSINFDNIPIDQNTKVINPLIKYILFIFKYLFNNSNLTDLNCRPLLVLQTQFTNILNDYDTKYAQYLLKKKDSNQNSIDEFLNNIFFKKNQTNFIDTNLNEFEIHNNKYQKVNKFYRASVYFIYKYINFIVNQGSAIVTTLEHLKFFFLTSANQIESYNKKELKDKRFTIHADFVQNNKFHIIDKSSKSNIFESEQKYVIKSKKIGICEEINIGNMNKYGLLPILQYLAGNETDIFELDMKILKDISEINEYTPDLLTQQNNKNNNLSSSKVKSIFIMLAHINTTINEEKDKLLVCNAVKDTLEYVNSISVVKNVKIVKNDSVGGFYNYKNKNYKNKNMNQYKQILSNITKNNINKLKRFTSMKNISKKKKLFSTRTKKNKI